MPTDYIAYNGASPTTAAQVKVATGTSIKTLLQVATPSTHGIDVIEYGISFDGFTAVQPGVIELVVTDVAATTGTSLTPTLYSGPNDEVSICVGGTSATCFSPSVEGTITATRMLDAQLLPPNQPYIKQFPLGDRPRVKVSSFLRVRVTMPATVNALCYLIWQE